jgi:predicted nucleic acid-binding protein
MTKYLFDTNSIYSFLYTTARDEIQVLIEEDNGQLCLLKDSYSELLNLTQRNFGSKVAWDLYQLLTLENQGVGNFPYLQVHDSYVDEIKSLMLRSCSIDPTSKKARKHDIGYIDAANLVTAKQNNRTLVTRDKRMHKAVNDGLIDVQIIKPFDDSFKVVHTHDFVSTSDMELKASIEASRFLKRLLDISYNPKTIAICEEFLKQYFEDLA